MYFGITGSIACGKSTCTNFMRKYGASIVDADILAREVVVPGSVGLRLLIETFGEEYLFEDGTLNRAKLASLVFHNPSQLAIINKIMFPLIKDEAARQLNDLKKAGSDLIGYDSALIIETGQADSYRPLVVVTTNPEIQLSRLMTRNQLSEAEARARIDKQLSSEEKVKYADFVIETTGSLQELEEKVITIISEIRKRMS